MNHTPGPWKVKVVEEGFGYGKYETEAIFGPGGEHIASIADFSPPGREANARLIAAAPDYHAACTQGAELDLPGFLEWLADRMVNVYGESWNVDYVLTCRDKAEKIRSAISKAGAQ